MKKLIPKQIDLEVTSACNLKCKGCLVNSQHHRAKHMDTEFYKSVIDRVIKENFYTVMVPWLEGEPLLHPEYDEILKYTSRADIPYYVTTNGTIWDEEVFNHILSPKSSCYQLIFSLDGLWDTKTIETARPGTNRKKVKEVINKFIRLKRKANRSNFDLCIKICDRGQDYEEIENYIYYWLETKGVDFVCLGKILDKKNEKSMRYYPCQYSDNNFLVVKADRRAVYCAYNEEMTESHDNTVKILDYVTPLLEFYNSEPFTTFRKNQREGIFHPVCQHCAFPYTGTGLRGEVEFRNLIFGDKKIYYQQDYYNQFFSYKKHWKPTQYYLQESTADLSKPFYKQGA
jgi:MoaA/NifB/PqqE/SkfB family radical SAM enzyme